MARIIAEGISRPHIATPLVNAVLDLEPATDVPGRQSLDEINGGHYPDYTITPFTVRPRLTVSCPDSPTDNDTLTAKALDRVSDETWKVVEPDGTETTVKTTDSGDYVIDGHTLKIKKNVAARSQLTVVYSCLYTYGNNRYRLQASLAVSCIPVTVGIPKLHCDMPTNISYYPIRDERFVTLNVSLRNSAGDWDAAKWGIQVEHLVEDGAGGLKWQIVAEHGSADENPTDAEFMLTGKTIRVDRDLMTDECRFRVRAKYQLPDGSWRGVGTGTTEADTPILNFYFRRSMPSFFNTVVRNLMAELPEQVKSVTPTMEVIDNIGVIPDDVADEYLAFLWYWSVGKADGSVSYKAAGTGRRVSISVEDMAEYGGTVRCVAVDRGWLSVLMEQDSVLADNTGAWLAAHVEEVVGLSQ